MLANQAVITHDSAKSSLVSNIRNSFSRLYSHISQSLSRRSDNAYLAFRKIIELEKRRVVRLALKKTTEAQSEREPEGWLTELTQSVTYPLYNGGNLVDSLELRLSQNTIFVGTKVYSSNDILEIAGKRFIVKLLPALYRNRGI